MRKEMSKPSNMTMEEAVAFSIKMEKRIITISYFIMFIGLIITIFTLIDYLTALESENWREVPGEIKQSEVISEQTHSTSNNPGSPSYNFTTYRPTIVYQYHVNGQLYENDRIRFGAIGGSDISETRRFVVRNPVGKQVTVYYSDNDPSNSVLLKGVTTNISLVAIFSGVAFLLMGYLFYKSRKIYVKPEYFVGK